MSSKVIRKKYISIKSKPEIFIGLNLIHQYVYYEYVTIYIFWDLKVLALFFVFDFLIDWLIDWLID